MTIKCSALLLGLDGGGTKTDAVLSDGAGKVIARAAGGATGFTGIPRPEAERRLKTVLEQVLRDVGGLTAAIRGVYAGVAGCGLPVIAQEYRAYLKSILPGAEHVEAGSDAVNALNAGAGVGDGIIAIAGTGACIYYRKNGRMTRISGWGYLLGDEGSGFDLGRRALAAALKALDGRSENTVMVKMLEKYAGCSLADWVPSIYAGDAKRMIASAAPVLIRAAEKGDPEAKKELDTAADGMANAIACALKACPVPSVVLGGSVWKSRLYTETVHAHLGENAAFVRPDVPPVLGAVLQAAVLAGIPADDEFTDSLASGLAEG